MCQASDFHPHNILRHMPCRRKPRPTHRSRQYFSSTGKKTHLNNFRPVAISVESSQVKLCLLGSSIAAARTENKKKRNPKFSVLQKFKPMWPGNTALKRLESEFVTLLD